MSQIYIRETHKKKPPCTTAQWLKGMPFYFALAKIKLLNKEQTWQGLENMEYLV